MGKRVIAIASGETERRALPHLVRHLESDGHNLLDVLIPPRHQKITPAMTLKLIRAAWFARIASPPDKFVILIDVDGKSREDVLQPFQQITGQLSSGINAAIRLAIAQWHLEAWYSLMKLVCEPTLERHSEVWIHLPPTRFKTRKSTLNICSAIGFTHR